LATGAIALHRCHRALELDCRPHGTNGREWLPTNLRRRRTAPRIGAPERRTAVDRRGGSAGSPLGGARHRRPRQDASDAAAAIMEGPGRILALDIFTDVSQGLNDEPLA
jgi:hypothetical protein